MSTPIQLSQDQHDIYLEIMMWAKIRAEANLKVCTIEGSVSEQHVVAYSSIEESQPELFLSTTLPSISNQIYLLLSDQEPDSFSSLLARYDAESESNDALSVGHISAIKENFLLKKGWHSIAILPISVIFPNFPDKSMLNGDNFEFQLLVFLTKEEYNFARRNGVTELAALFKEKGRPFSVVEPHTYSDTTPISKETTKRKSKRDDTASTTTSKESSQTKATDDGTSVNRSVTNATLVTKKTPKPTPASEKERASAPEEQPDNRSISQKIFKLPSSIKETTTEPERLEHFVEVAIGSILILCGLILGGFMFAYKFTIAPLFPVCFAIAGAATVYSAIKAIKDTQ